jgi:hypothetical protein
MYTIEKVLSKALPDFEEVRQLVSLCGISGDFRPLFYDIETTGLSKKTTHLYLIGALSFEEHGWMLHQWFAEQPEEEPQVLTEFLHFVRRFSHVVHFNGNRFDAPYLIERCNVHGLSCSIQTLEALDLYQYTKPYKTLLQLNHLRQSDLETFLGLPERRYPDGKDCITHYKSWCREGDVHARDLTLGHNEEDLTGLLLLIRLLSYEGLAKKLWTLQACSLSTDELLFTLTLQYPLPAPVSGGIPGLYLKAEDTSLKLLCHSRKGRLQQFYINYKDYEYLPAEDCAIPKSLAAYMDKGLRQKATPENCYTWFAINEDFIHNPEKQRQYLDHAIPYLLMRLG